MLSTCFKSLLTRSSVYLIIVCCYSDEIISLVEQQQEQEVLELLRYPNGLLHEACNRGSPDLVKLLLERGVSTAEWDKVDQ